MNIDNSAVNNEARALNFRLDYIFNNVTGSKLLCDRNIARDDFKSLIKSFLTYEITKAINDNCTCDQPNHIEVKEYLKSRGL